jgi:hypothetical protein
MRFTIKDRTFIVSNRKRPTRGKSELYLLEVLPDGKRRYVSSLYPTDHPGTYRFEKDTRWYLLRIENSSGKIAAV